MTIVAPRLRFALLTLAAAAAAVLLGGGFWGP